MQDYTNDTYDFYLHNTEYIYKLEYCEDGTVMYLAFDIDTDTWATSTNNKKDAKKSFYFSKKSFDTLFWEAFPEGVLDSLDKTIIYKFILLHPENRLVVKHEEPELVLLEPTDSTYFRLPFLIDCYTFITPPPIHFLETFCNSKKRGIIIKVINKESDILEQIFKYDFEYYKFISRIRGNSRNIGTRYLQLLKNSEWLAILTAEYFEYTNVFQTLNYKLEQLYEYFFLMYITIYIEDVKMYNLDPLVYNILKSIHYYSKKSFFCKDIVIYVIHHLKNCSYNINKLFLLTNSNSN